MEFVHVIQHLDTLNKALHAHCHVMAGITKITKQPLALSLPAAQLLLALQAPLVSALRPVLCMVDQIIMLAILPNCVCLTAVNTPSINIKAVLEVARVSVRMDG
jgi:hypothetical protein